MVKITRHEADYLRNKKFGEKVKKTFTRHPTYYCVEDYQYKTNTEGDVTHARPISALKVLYDYRRKNYKEIKSK